MIQGGGGLSAQLPEPLDLCFSLNCCRQTLTQKKTFDERPSRRDRRAI